MLLSVQRIWDQGAYNAFTDLRRHRDRWVCVFREGTAHAGDNGSVRVLVSDDGEAWHSAAYLTEQGIDLRDPKLSVTPDGRLMLLVGGTIYAGDDNPLRRSMVSFSQDAIEWTPWTQVLPDGHWLWRVTWHRGIAYGVSKLGDGDIPKQGFLWRSHNGREYELAHRYKVPAMSETTLRFTAGDTAVALARRTGPGGGNAWIGSSAPSYTQWRWVSTDRPVGGPNFIVLPDGTMWAASRVYGAETTTGLFRMAPDSGIELALTLPSGGDTSYAGMVWHDELLWLTYYSSHEEKPSIYLAKIRPPA
ncbi:MAG: sialidase family protein [Armatimonadota bacterium]|nr:sialidase family protein [Armatimonadota bacterium]